MSFIIYRIPVIKDHKLIFIPSIQSKSVISKKKILSGMKFLRFQCYRKKKA